MIGWLLLAQAAATLRLSGFAPETGCERAPTAEVVVCARRRDGYRLPLPDEARLPQQRVRGEPLRPDIVLAGNARCGPFAGERACSKREAEGYGYGRGRDPVTVLGKVAGALLGRDD